MIIMLIIIIIVMRIMEFRSGHSTTWIFLSTFWWGKNRKTGVFPSSKARTNKKLNPATCDTSSGG